MCDRGISNMLDVPGLCRYRRRRRRAGRARKLPYLSREEPGPLPALGAGGRPRLARLPPRSPGPSAVRGYPSFSGVGGVPRLWASGPWGRGSWAGGSAPLPAPGGGTASRQRLRERPRSAAPRGRRGELGLPPASAVASAVPRLAAVVLARGWRAGFASCPSSPLPAAEAGTPPAQQQHLRWVLKGMG